MSKTKPDFRRMLLWLPHSRQDYAAVPIIAELAGLLGTDLVGTYVQDSSVPGLAGLPNAREFRAGRWHPSSSEQLAQDLAFAAREAERLFRQAAGRGGPALAFNASDRFIAEGQEAGVDDIIVVIEPTSAIDRATHQFGESFKAAFRSSSSVLLIPGQARQLSGPILVAASHPEDPAIDTALAVAATTRERLILIPLRAATETFSILLKTARASGLVISVADAVFHDGDILLPAHLRGGLLIMSRRPTLERPTLSQVPILLVSSRLSPPGTEICDPKT